MPKCLNWDGGGSAVQIANARSRPILRAAKGRGDALTFRKLALGYIQPVDGVIPGDKGQDPD